MKRLIPLLIVLSVVIAGVPMVTSDTEAATIPVGIYGTVQNATGSPMAGVTITLVNTTTGLTLVAVTGSDGTYGITPGSGTFNVSASYTDYQANTTYRGKVLTYGGALQLNFTMSEVLGAVHGFVTDGSTPVIGVMVTVYNDAHSYNTTTVAPLGEYSIRGIKPGTYVEVFYKKGYEKNNTAPIVIARGAIVQKNATITGQMGGISGKVQTGSGSLEEVTVTVQGTGKSWTTTTDSNGNYTVSSLPSDSYTVTFSKSGYDSKSIGVSLEPFEERTNLDVTMSKTKSNSTDTYLFGFDLTHSLMIIGFLLVFAVIAASLFVSFKARSKPEMLHKEEEKKE